MSCTHENLIQSTIQFVQAQHEQYDGSHDWQHIHRVWKMAKFIAGNEKNVNLLVIELAALLHDVGDHKFHDGNENTALEKIREHLYQFHLPEDIIKHVERIVGHISFSSFKSLSNPSREFQIVQDADRLDAIGAIGIARAFHYGGFRGRTIYNPGIPPKKNMSKEDYKKNNGPTLNHFYEKLLLLKDQIHTETGRQIASNRHAFMEQFLTQFYNEWETTG